MGSGMCSRRQKGLLQTAFCLLTLACLASGVFLYNHLRQKVRSAEALAQKYKQQQEALSAQLQGECPLRGLRTPCPDFSPSRPCSSLGSEDAGSSPASFPAVWTPGIRAASSLS